MSPTCFQETFTSGKMTNTMAHQRPSGNPKTSRDSYLDLGLSIFVNTSELHFVTQSLQSECLERKIGA